MSRIDIAEMTFEEKITMLTPENRVKVAQEINRLLAIQKEGVRHG